MSRTLEITGYDELARHLRELHAEGFALRNVHRDGDQFIIKFTGGREPGLFRELLKKRAARMAKQS